MISIIGAGRVGSAAAYRMLQLRIGDVVLVDIAENLAQGEALDMMQAAPAIEFDGRISGSSDFGKIAGSDLVVITSGQARQPGMSRNELVTRNAKIVRSVVREVVKYAPDCRLMVVTNPVDAMTCVAQQASGFDRSRVFGMGSILDTLRFRSYIAMELGVSREDVRGMVIGEHGDSMVPLVRHASVSGIPITHLLDRDQIDQIVRLTRSSGADVIKLKASTSYAPSAVIAILADAVLRGRNRVVGVSTVLRGEYGASGVSIGVPCVLGRTGVERILEIPLDDSAKADFEKSVAEVRKTLQGAEG
jgi:malate dehydrogenase